MNDDRYEIRLGGSGGQGVITAAVVLAEAVALYESKHVCQTQSYGPEARGGKSKAEVVISSKPIDYPKVLKMDIFLAMNQASCDAYFYDFKPNGLLIIDSTLVEQVPTSRVLSIPFTSIARKLGREIVANMVALGAIGHFCPMVSSQNIVKALLARVPKGTEQLNRKALKAGADAAKSFDLDQLPRSISADDDELF
nr:2-oxoacid:acceptor oxidoreductase family protein [Desulfobulbaceae bacterium]